MRAILSTLAVVSLSATIAAPALANEAFAAPLAGVDAAAELLDNSPFMVSERITGTKTAGRKVMVFAPQVRSPKKLDIDDVSPWVDAVTLLPGERFPLKALSPGGTAIAVKWQAKDGEIAYADKLAVWTAPLEAGCYTLSGTGLVAGRTMTRNLTMIVTVPTSNVKDGKLEGYRIGTYPKGFGPRPTFLANRSATSRAGTPRAGGANRSTRSEQEAYTVPAGFVLVDAKSAATPVSTHYKLGDFAGKDAAVGGKRFMFFEPRMVEKLERLMVTLQTAGYPCSKLAVMSAYRSPALNRAIGNVTSLSRHTYGDAADVIAQDFNRDKRVDLVDAHILLAAVTQLDKETNLTGGAHLYPPNSAHQYFVHTDLRGQLIRW